MYYRLRTYKFCKSYHCETKLLPLFYDFPFFVYVYQHGNQKVIFSKTHCKVRKKKIILAAYLILSRSAHHHVKLCIIKRSAGIKKIMAKVCETELRRHSRDTGSLAKVLRSNSRNKRKKEKKSQTKEKISFFFSE